MIFKTLTQKTTPYFKKYFSVFLVLLFLVVTFGTMSDAVAQLTDSDTGFLLATGKYIVENKEVPTTNPFIIHEGHQTIIQQWLFAVMVYGTHTAFGLGGLFVLTMICFSIILFLLWKLMGFYTKNANIKIMILTAFVYIVRYWVEPRPTIITSILVLCVILILESYRRNKHKWTIVFLPLISLLQINLHASFWPLLFVFMLPYIAPNIIRFFQSPKATFVDWWKQYWKVLVILIPSLGLGFVNPNGLRGILYVFLSYGTIEGLHTAPELYAVTVNSKYGFALLIAIVSLMFYVYKKKNDIDIALVYMSIGSLILALPHMRNIWFIAFATMPILCVLCEDIMVWQPCSKKSQKARSAVIMAILWITLIATMTMCSTFRFRDSETFPVQAADYLDQFTNKDDLIIYTEQYNGSYMQYRGYKTYIDGRPETFTPEINGKEHILKEQHSARWYPADAERLIEKYKFTHMIVHVDTPINGVLYDHDDYEMIIHGNGYLVYERVDFDGESIYTHNK